MTFNLNAIPQKSVDLSEYEYLKRKSKKFWPKFSTDQTWRSPNLDFY